MSLNSESEYRRYTAVLREDKRNYAITHSKRPRGKATVEINGNQGVLKFFVKNLKPVHSPGNYKGYRAWLLGEEGEKQIPVNTGIIIINDEGVGEGSCSFEADNVLGTGLNIEIFTTMEVRVKNGRNDIPDDTVLIGHLELEEVTLPEEPKMEKVAPFGAGLPSHQWWKFYPGYLHNLMSNQSLRSKESLCWPSSNSERTSHGVRSEPVFQGHQLVGLQNDQKGTVKHLVHGIPGRFCERDQPYGGATGYLYWQPLPRQNYKAGDYGYWLIYLDPITGEVVLPHRQTIPPNCQQCRMSEKE